MIHIGIFLITGVIVFFITRFFYLRFGEKRLNEYFHSSIKRHSDEVENIYKQMRGWKHDYHNHIQVLKAHLSIGDLPKIESYLNGLETDLIEVDSVFRTGNVMVDAILTAKLSLAKAKNISVDATAIVPPVLPIAPVDMCIVMGNLLDNAIEACEMLKEGAFIRVYMGIYKEMLYISVQNADSGAAKTKSSGLGLSRIEKIANKYEGSVNRQRENGVYAMEVLFSMGGEHYVKM